MTPRMMMDDNDRSRLAYPASEVDPVLREATSIIKTLKENYRHQGISMYRRMETWLREHGVPS